MSDPFPVALEQIEAIVQRVVSSQPVVDMHTHLYAPAFGTPTPNANGRTDPNGLLLFGVDELLTYHYLVAEVFRVVPATKLPYDQFWKMSKRRGPITSGAISSSKGPRYRKPAAASSPP